MSKNVTTGLAVAAAAAAVVAVTPQAASAAPYYCGVADSGTTTHIGVRNGKLYYKAAPGCNDFNLVDVQYGGNYGANYQKSDGSWALGSGNYTVTASWTGLRVLISNITTGAPMHVLSTTNGTAYVNR
ncbi:hypothetical protein GCM10022221_62930 [Actinocorallia aurea]